VRLLERFWRRGGPGGAWPQAAGRGGGFADAGSSRLEVAPAPARSAPAPGRGLPHLSAEVSLLSAGPHGHRARMRDTLLTRGPDALADDELLEMLLFSAMPEGDTRPLAKALINRFGSFAAVLAAPQQTLIETPGLGPHSVAALKLVQAAAIRLSRAEVIGRPVLGNWDRLMAYLHAVLAREKIEQFRVLFLDAKNRLIADESQARGTVNHTPVYPREVVKRALELHATGMILVHNHPSGDPTPSRADIETTREIGRAAALLSIALHDHVIVGHGRWLSFRQAGLL
jgi:DNA repair protein RadC